MNRENIMPKTTPAKFETLEIGAQFYHGQGGNLFVKVPRLGDADRFTNAVSLHSSSRSGFGWNETVWRVA
jgi:hypothetical protein